MKGAFALKSDRDLYDKLLRDFAELKSNLTNSDAAFNFFVTAWHLLEWRYPKNKNSELRGRIRDSEPILQVCEHLAVGAKHFAPENSNLSAVSSTEETTGGLARPLVRPLVRPLARPLVQEPKLIAHLTGTAAETFGSKVDIEKLADETMRYWRGEYDPD